MNIFVNIDEIPWYGYGDKHCLIFTMLNRHYHTTLMHEEVEVEEEETYTATCNLLSIVSLCLKVSLLESRALYFSRKQNESVHYFFLLFDHPPCAPALITRNVLCLFLVVLICCNEGQKWNEVFFYVNVFLTSTLWKHRGWKC